MITKRKIKLPERRKRRQTVSLINLITFCPGGGGWCRAGVCVSHSPNGGFCVKRLYDGFLVSPQLRHEKRIKATLWSLSLKFPGLFG